MREGETMGVAIRQLAPMFAGEAATVDQAT